MKVTKEKAAEHRAAIVQAASKLFRDQGIEGVGVAEITSEAGLTHGGFYRHFDSKEALFREACEQAFAEITALRKRVLAKPDGEQRMRRGYLSAEHMDDPDCLLATLGEEVARRGPDMQAVFAAGLRKLLATNGEAVGDTEWNHSAMVMATLVGTLIMARAVRKSDKPLADALVHAALKTPI